MGALFRVLFLFFVVCSCLHKTSGTKIGDDATKAKNALEVFQKAAKNVSETISETLTGLINDITNLQNVTISTSSQELTAISSAMRLEIDSIKNASKNDYHVDIDSCLEDVEYRINSAPQNVNTIQTCLDSPKEQVVNEIVANLTNFEGNITITSAILQITLLQCDIKNGSYKEICYATFLTDVERSTAVMNADLQQKTRQANKNYQTLNEQFLDCSTQTLTDVRNTLENLVREVVDCANEIIYTATTSTTPAPAPTSPASASSPKMPF